MLIYLGWIVAAFLGGFLLALWQRKKHHSLRENFARVEFFKGRGYREIVAIAGAKPNSINRRMGVSSRCGKKSVIPSLLNLTRRIFALA